MKRILIFAAITMAILPAVPACASRSAAREALQRGDYNLAVREYAAVAKTSGAAGLAAEYGYACALAGFTELSLSQFDRAFLLDPTDDSVHYFSARVIEALGLRDAAREITRRAPDWLTGPPAVGALEHERKLETFREALAAANLLMAQKRYVSAAERFYRLTAAYPGEHLAWAGYSIALENLGAFKTAAAAVAKDFALREKKGLDEDTRQMLLAHQSELGNRDPATAFPKPANISEALKGRYLAFCGGNYTHTESGGGIFSLNARVGKFLTNRFDAGLDTGFAGGNDDNDYNGLSFGISGRFNTPLSSFLSATTATRIAVAPMPSDTFTFILSPGVSHFMPSGSIDLFLDIALTGPLKGSETLSLGYTIYFGRPSK